MNQLALFVTDVVGEPVQLEVLLRQDTVGIYHGNLAVVFLREELRAWLNQPAGQFGHDSLTWTVANDDIVIEIRPLFVSCPLRARDLSVLREHV
jgi:hypothetical protein